MKQILLLLAFSLVLPLAACGKKGDLLPPAGYEQPKPTTSEPGAGDK